MPDRSGRGFRRKAEGLPADLFLWAGINTSAQRFGHELRSETDPDHGQIARQTFFEQPSFVAKKGIDGFLVCSDGRAQDDKQVWLASVKRAQVFHSGLDVADVETMLAQDRLETAEVFKTDVLQDEGLFL